jgi:nucleotide-binding universal stress UspA family protein
VNVEGLVREADDAAREILKLAREGAFGLVVLGRRGMGDTNQRLGSTAFAVLDAAPCPVLLVGERPVGDGE